MATTTKPTDDLAAIKDLIVWARRERIVLTQVSVGTIAVAMQDLALGDDMPKSKDTNKETSVDPYHRWGGAVLEQLKEQAGQSTENNSTFIDDDD